MVLRAAGSGVIHVSCAAHTLQLAVKDAVKGTRGVDGMFVKARKLAKKGLCARFYNSSL